MTPEPPIEMVGSIKGCHAADRTSGPAGAAARLSS